MTTSFARVRRSTGTVIGPAGGGAAFAAASEGETMKWLRPRPAARLTTAVTAMIQIVRVEPVMSLMVGVPSGSSAVPRSASLGVLRRRRRLQRGARSRRRRAPARRGQRWSRRGAGCASSASRLLDGLQPAVDLGLVRVVELLLDVDADLALGVRVGHVLAAGVVGHRERDLARGQVSDRVGVVRVQ